MKKFRLVALSLIAACGLPAWAAGQSQGVVNTLMIYDGVVIFSIGSPVQNHTNKPACSTIGEEWAVSLSTDAGRAIYAALLTALTTGQTVTIGGTGSCGAWSDREEARSLLITR